MIIYLPLIIALVGLIMFVLAKDARISEIGKIMFWTGLLVTLFSVGAGHYLPMGK